MFSCVALKINERNNFVHYVAEGMSQLDCIAERGHNCSIIIIIYSNKSYSLH